MRKYCFNNKSKRQHPRLGLQIMQEHGNRVLNCTCSTVILRTLSSITYKHSNVIDTPPDGDSNDLVVIVKESKGTKKGGGKEEEYGRARITLEELEKEREIERWFPLSKNQKPTPAIIHLKISYSFSMVSDLISIFSEVTEEEVVKEKLSLSALQYNVVRVVLALMPLFRILRQFLELTRWKNPAASAFALQVRRTRIRGEAKWREGERKRREGGR